jgi:hypothetical protein
LYSKNYFYDAQGFYNIKSKHFFFSENSSLTLRQSLEVISNIEQDCTSPPLFSTPHQEIDKQVLVVPVIPSSPCLEVATTANVESTNWTPSDIYISKKIFKAFIFILIW